MTEHWMCTQCHSLNSAAAKRCYKCRAPRATAEFHDAGGRAGAPGLSAMPPRDPSLIGGIFGGLVFGTLVTALWIWFDFNMTRGFFYLSWLVGAGVAIGVVVGGRGRTSFPLVLFSVLLTALALVVGEYLIVSSILATEAHLETSRIPIARPEDVAAALPDLIRQAPLRPVLWVIALVTAWGVPWARLVGPAPDRRRLEDR